MGEQELKELLLRTEARCRSNSHRLDELEGSQKAVTELALSVRVLATEQQNIKEDLGEVKTDVKSLTLKAGRRFEALLDKALWLLAGGVLCWFLSQMGL